MSLIDFEDFFEASTAVKAKPKKKPIVAVKAKAVIKPTAKPTPKPTPKASPKAQASSPIVFRPVSGSVRAQAGRQKTLEPSVQVQAKSLISTMNKGVQGKTNFTLTAKPKKKGFAGLLGKVRKVRESIQAATPNKPAKKKRGFGSGIIGKVQKATTAAVQSSKPKPKAKKKKSSLFSLNAAAHKATERLTKSVGEKLKDLPKQKREQVAARVVLGPLQKLASKARQTPIHTVATAKKAIEAVKPIAEACNCKAAPVIKAVDAKLVADGFPSGTAKTLLSQLHDMNESLEKAATQRLVTHEHDVLTAKHDFEHSVLARLAQIAQCLPKCHPARTATFLSIFKKAK